jgi:hypothetical protein
VGVKNKEPWQSFPEIWKDEKAFMTYLRGAFRSIWSRYPAKLEWKKRQMIPPPEGYKGRAKSVGYCAYCNGMFSASSFEVDHIEQAGSFSNKEEAIEWFWRLLDTNDNWCLACKPCHKVKSYAEREGLSFDEARLQKEVINILKKSVAEVKQFCYDYGYSDSHLSNPDKRRKAVEKILRSAS